MRRILCLIAGAVLLAAPAAAQTWTDAMGRTVDVPSNPQRLISLVPSITEILFGLGLGERVVGVTDACTWPEQARSRPRVGNYSGPSLEAVVALQPDVVFASADMARPAWVDRLEELDIAVYVVYPRDLDTTVRAIRRIGAVTGATREGRRMAGRIEEAAQLLRDGRTEQTAPRALIAVMIDPLVVASPRTLAGDLLEIAGGRNVVPAEGGRWPTWGPEALLLADPDVIIVSPHPGQRSPEAFFKRFPELTAVRTGRVATIDPDWLQRPGPRLVQGMHALAKALSEGNGDAQ